MTEAQKEILKLLKDCKNFEPNKYFTKLEDIGKGKAS